MGKIPSPPLETEYDRYIKSLQEREWRLEDVPFYEKGKPMKSERWHDVDWLDYCDKVMGRKYGSQGIGKLREVALARITEWENHPFVKDDLAFFGKVYRKRSDIAKWQEQHENYRKILEENGVRVHWIEFPEPPVSPFGPMQWMRSCGGILVLRTGSIIGKPGCSTPFTWGRFEWYARWLFWNLGIPPILHIIGKGVCEAGQCIFVAENTVLAPFGSACNQEGLDQLTPVLRMSGVNEINIMVNPGYTYGTSGGTVHTDTVIGPLDIGKVLLYPAGICFNTRKWLLDRTFEIIEADEEEQRKHIICNLVTLEPGKVIMHQGAEKTIRKVRKTGTDVIEAPYSEHSKQSGGIKCATGYIQRDPGPGLEEIRR